MSKVDLYPNSKSPPSQAQVQTGTAFSGNKVAADVNVMNDIGVTFSGLALAMKVTTMHVTDIANQIPATPLAKRNAIAITNLDSVNTIYLGPSTVTTGRTLGTTCGWEVGPNETFNVDITDGIEIYAIADSGVTVLTKVLELA